MFAVIVECVEEDFLNHKCFFIPHQSQYENVLNRISDGLKKSDMNFLH